jgi:hypothetical protein
VAVLLERKPGDLNWWVLGLAWLVNPAIWAAITLTVAGRRRAAGAAAGCGMVLALVTLPWYFSGVAGLPGYWAWVGSAGVVLAAAVGPWHGVAAEPGAAADRAGIG